MISTLRHQVNKKQDKLFATFCKINNLNNIREYESLYSSISNETLEKRLQFEAQIAKLENALQYFNEDSMHIRTKLASFQEKILKEELLVKSFKETNDQFDEKDRLYQETIDTLRDSLATTASEAKTLLSSVYSIKQQITALHKSNEEQNKHIFKKESRIEELASEKFSILRKSKLEEIKLTFDEGSLEEFSLSNTNIEEAMEVDGGMSRTQVAMQSFIPNYKKLTRAQKDNGSTDIETGFLESLRSLTNEIGRIAPNMKAVDKLDEVEQKLRETAEEFDQTRRDAKDAKDKFNLVKEERFFIIFYANDI